MSFCSASPACTPRHLIALDVTPQYYYLTYDLDDLNLNNGYPDPLMDDCLSSPRSVDLGFMGYFMEEDENNNVSQEELNLIDDRSDTVLDSYVASCIDNLTAENLELKRKLEKRNSELLKLKKQSEKHLGSSRTDDSDSSQKSTQSDHPHLMGVIKRHELRGMIECPEDRFNELLFRLVQDMKPQVSTQLKPANFSGYIIFMTLKHRDYIGDEQTFSSFYSKASDMVMSCAKKHRDDLGYCLMYLAFSIRLLQLLRQYSGDPQYHQGNTSPDRQKDQYFVSFDVKNFIADLESSVTAIYRHLRSLLQTLIQTVAVPAILEYEGISITGVSRPPQRRFSLFSPKQTRQSYSLLEKELNRIYDLSMAHGLDWPVISAIFAQTLHYVCVHPTNHVFLRKDVCNWSRGMQIKYNLNSLENWCKEHNLKDDVLRELDPIRQIANLLIINKSRSTKQTVQCIVEACPDLKPNQVVKLLTMYSGDTAEEKIPLNLVQEVEKEMQGQRKEEDIMHDSLITPQRNMDLDIPFVPSEVALESIEIPTSLKLQYLTLL